MSETEIIATESNLPAMRQPDLPALPDEGIGAVALAERERAVLDRPTETHKIAIRPDAPDGKPILYIPHEFYRVRLREAVGFGSYGEKVLKFWKEPGEIDEKTGELKSETLYVWLALYIRGSLISSAIGSHTYSLRNKRMDYSDSFEAASSNAFVRCCKHAGLGLEPWDPRFCEEFVAEHCIKVTVKTSDGKMQVRWRLKTSPPFEGEIAAPAAPEIKKSPEPKPEVKAEPKTSPPPVSSSAGPLDDRSVNLNTEAPRASTEQVERLKELTANLNPEAVAAALKQRRAATFEELTAKQAANVIEKLEGATA